MDQAVIVIQGTAEFRVFIKVDAVNSFTIKNGVSPLITFNLHKYNLLVSKNDLVIILNSVILYPAVVKSLGEIFCSVIFFPF